MTGSNQSNADDAQATLDRWRAEEQTATSGPWEYDGLDISQTGGSYGPVVELEGYAGWVGCDHTISMTADDGTFIASARTAVPALLDVVEHVTSDDFARAIVSASHETDPAQWLPEDQRLADRVAAMVRTAVATAINQRTNQETP